MGKISHQHKFAYDFGMPVGTPILAARSGTVYSVRDGHTRGGNDPRLRSRANEVVVVHADATFATYGHLRPGIGVRVGQRVETGTLLGYSGNTGYTDGPHLHFEVWVRSRKGDRETVPVRFRVDGRSVELAQGARVEPQAQR
jgi:murein DD-endopeptidase MepM/ murein hydrolase activator NlpD